MGRESYCGISFVLYLTNSLFTPLIPLLSHSPLTPLSLPSHSSFTPLFYSPFIKTILPNSLYDTFSGFHLSFGVGFSAG